MVEEAEPLRVDIEPSPQAPEPPATIEAAATDAPPKPVGDVEPGLASEPLNAAYQLAGDPLGPDGRGGYLALEATPTPGDRLVVDMETGIGEVQGRVRTVLQPRQAGE